MENEKNFEFTYQQLSNYIAGFLILSFFIFIAGYFWGKKSGIESFREKIENDSLEDKMYYAFCALNEMATDSDTANLENHDESPDASGELAPISQEPKAYFAVLSNFTSLSDAEKFAYNLKSRGFGVKIIEKSDNIKNGKKVGWYQVVTEPNDSKENLESLINQIKKVSKLNNLEVLTIEKN